MAMDSVVTQRSALAAQTSYPTLAMRHAGEEWKLAIAAPWGWGTAPPLEAVL